MKIGKALFKSSLLMASIALTGCAGSYTKKVGVDPKELEGHSEALQVMMSGGNAKFLRDIEVGEAHDVSEDTLLTLTDAAIGLSFAQGTISSMPGVSDGTMSAVFLLNAFIDESSLERKGSWMEAWMPASMAETEEEARIIWTQMIEEAALSSLPEGYSAELYELESNPPIGSSCTLRAFKVTGPKCPDGTCIIYGALKHDPSRDLCDQGKMGSGPTPGIVNSGDATSYFPSGFDKVGVFQVNEKGMEKFLNRKYINQFHFDLIDGFDYSAYYSALSSKLPSWAYWYFGPENRNNHTQMPVVLNQGKTLFFIKPKPGQ
ncbi:hypothetical protein [Marinobacterium stanieri]|uniref:hypothetical protein n=1 Tax=Marinobacterium stanieri TaxID=49186 RepID=UPI003A94CA97